MRETMTCKGCGTEVEVDRTFVVRVVEDPLPLDTAARVTIYQGGRVVHECAEGTYGFSRKD